MIVQKTQNVTTLLDLTNVPVGKVIMGTEKNVKVCQSFHDLVKVYVPGKMHKIFNLDKILGRNIFAICLSLYTPM